MRTLRDYFCLGRKYLVYNLVSRNLKVKYRRSVFGTFWTLIAPLSLAATYYVVFGKILQVRLPHYLAHMVAGVLAWNFFSATVFESIDALIYNQPLISKVPVPVQIFPWVTAVTNAVTLAISIPVIGLALWISGVHVGLPILATPFLAVALFLMVYGLSVTFAVGAVFFRDIKHAISIVLQLWLYATPVFYDRSLIPAKFHFLLFVNPLASVWSCFHDTLLKATWPEPSLALAALLWTGVACACGYGIMRRFGGTVAEAL